MEKLNEQNSSNLTDTLPVETKHAWIFGILGVALALSVALNLLFLFNFDEKLGPKKIAPQTNVSQDQELETLVSTTTLQNSDVLSQTHIIDKQVDRNGVSWTGIKTTSTKEYAEVGYELWRTDDSGTLLIDKFILSICDNVTWDVLQSGGIRLTHTTSPCEAFVVFTDIIYDADGKELFRLTEDSWQAGHSGARNVVFAKNGGTEYVVDVIFDGVCRSKEVRTDNSIPDVVLQGVKVTSSKGERVFMLPVEEKIPCDVGYGERLLNPSFTEVTFDEEKIEFTLPNERLGIISLQSSDYAEVTFK